MSINAQGYTRRRLPEILADIEDSFRETFGEDIDLEPHSPLGQLAGVLSQPLADIEEALEAVYNSQYPDSADGASLDRVCALVGVSRLKATETVVRAVVSGDQGTVIPAETSRARLKGTEYEFLCSNAVTIDQNSAAQLTITVDTLANEAEYSVTINATAVSITSGTEATEDAVLTALQAAINSAELGVTALAEDTTGSGEVDTLIVQTDNLDTPFIGAVSSNLNIEEIGAAAEFIAEQTGAIVVPQHTLTVIETPVSGWNSIDNWLQGEIGRNTETDSELRLRRKDSLQVTGAGTTEAIIARIKQEVSNVSGITVVENRTDVTDSDGRPPHSIECIVSGGEDEDIAEELWLAVPSGIQTHGTEEQEITDSQGYSHYIYFSRAVEIECWLHVTITEDPEGELPDDAELITLVKSAIMDYASEHLNTGVDVIMQRLEGVVILDIDGIGEIDAAISFKESAEDPDPVYPDDYDTARLSIAPTETAVFTEDRISLEIIRN